MSAAIDRPHGFFVSDEALARAAASFADNPAAAGAGAGNGGGIAWRPLLKQSCRMLVVQHTYRAAFEDGTWAETKRGPFWDDYFVSAKSICCWDDGDKFTTNNLFHPMMGSTSAFVFANNHEPSQRTPFGNTRRYWSNKTKAMAYAAVYSAYFELGPVLSEAAIGNVGLTPGQQTWHDIVITPTVGTALSVGEDLLRVHVIDKVDRRSHALGHPARVAAEPDPVGRERVRGESAVERSSRPVAPFDRRSPLVWQGDDEGLCCHRIQSRGAGLQTCKSARASRPQGLLHISTQVNRGLLAIENTHGLETRHRLVPDGRVRGDSRHRGDVGAALGCAPSPGHARPLLVVDLAVRSPRRLDHPAST